MHHVFLSEVSVALILQQEIMRGLIRNNLVHTDFYHMFQVKNFSHLFLATAFVFLNTLDADGAQKYTLHENGLGPVTIGMTVTQASKALGIELRPAGTLDEDEIHCHYVYPEGKFGSIGFMVLDGQITRVDVDDSSYSTDTGITVGQSERKVYEKYRNRITEQIHPYIGKEGKYLIIKLKKDYQLIFETDRGSITSFRMGKLPSVAYEEGCS